MKRSYGKKGSHATWSRGTLRLVIQEPSLEILPTQDKTQHESSKVSQNHSCIISLLFKIKLWIHETRHPIYRNECLSGQDGKG